MADNITLPATGTGTAVPVVATRNIAGEHFQRVFISGDDSAGTDSFGRWRTSEPVSQFTSQNEYLNNTTAWEQALSGTGAITHRQLENAVRLSTGGTATGASATRQTRRYMRYRPGRSFLVKLTFACSAPQTNAVAEIGYYDQNNGIFFQRAGTAYRIIRRTGVSGSPNDINVIEQANWNLDKMDGTGDSGYTLNVEQAQILVIDLQYLGVGRVRVGFVVNGNLIYCHQFLHSGIINTVYMSTACLPVRARIWNNGTAGGTTTLDVICTSVMVEGGTSSDERGETPIQFSVNNGITAKAMTTTLAPVISIRAATKIGGSAAGTVTNHGWITPSVIENFALSNGSSLFEIRLNATLTGTSWVAVDPASLTEYDVSATAVSGGTLLDSGYVPNLSNGKGGAATALDWAAYLLVYGQLAGLQDTITLCARALTGTGTSYGTITWCEQYQ